VELFLTVTLMPFAPVVVSNKLTSIMTTGKIPEYGTTNRLHRECSRLPLRAADRHIVSRPSFSKTSEFKGSIEIRRRSAENGTLTYFP
jgi:hypothetical protein